MFVVHHTVEPGTRAGRFSFGPSNDDNDVEDQRVRSLGSPDPSKPVAAGTFYASLTRKATLPSLQTTCRDKDVKHVYDKMAAGSFLGRYEYDDELRTRGFKTPSFVVIVGVSDTGDDSVPSSLRGDLIRVEVHSSIVVQDGYVKRKVETTYNARYKDEFSGLLGQDEKLFLSHRILHHIVRLMATELPSVVVEVIFEALIPRYLETRNYRGCLDVSLVNADFAIHKVQSDENIGQAMVQVGEYLETVKEFEKGARVYAQVADTYFVAASTVQQAKVCHKAGLAFMNAGSFDEAEDYLVLGWSHLTKDGGRLVLNSTEATGIFTSMLILYQKRQESAAREAMSNGSDHIMVQPLLNLLIALLYTAGFRPSADGMVRDMILSDGPRFSTGFLKRSLRGNKKGAFRLLLGACRQPGHGFFHQSLLKAKDPAGQELITIRPERSDSSSVPDENAKANAKVARDLLKKERMDGATTCYSCAKCDTKEVPGGPKHMQCPCKVVFYCGEECQLAHWKEHKKYCTFKNKK